MTQATATPTPNTTGKSLLEIALHDAIKSVKEDDSAAFHATLALSLVMANRQIERVETNEDITEKANKATFRVFLKKYAEKGGLVWRDSQHQVDAICALKGKARANAASDYIDKKDKGARLVDGLAKLRTWSFRLMKHVCENHADVIRDMIVTKQAGAGGDALAEKFREFIRNTYGKSFAQLTQTLASNKTPKEQTHPIDSIMKRAADMTDTDLALLVARIQGLWAERQHIAAEIAETLETEEEADARIEALGPLGPDAATQEAAAA